MLRYKDGDKNAFDRINLNIAFFVLAAGTAFLIAIAAVSSQFAKATKISGREYAEMYQRKENTSGVFEIGRLT